MVTATLRITNIEHRADATRKTLPFSSIEGSDIIIASPLSENAQLNEHLVWFWGTLKHERRFLKSLQAGGGKLTIHAAVRHGVVEIKPDGAELLHLLGATLLINGQ
ncbi:MAG TPA: hypothetical protein VM532_15665 [Burkholderiales bacterium]|jgi:hypothetical protein|nr:hypothetical protein [Burkholderiales bacterium]